MDLNKKEKKEIDLGRIDMTKKIKEDNELGTIDDLGRVYDKEIPMEKIINDENNEIQ